MPTSSCSASSLKLANGIAGSIVVDYSMVSLMVEQKAPRSVSRRARVEARERD